MSDTLPFATDILLAAVAGLGVLLAHRLGEWVRMPSSMLVLAASAIVASFIPARDRPRDMLVVRIVTIALVAVLFSGGMSMGRRRFRAAAGPILSLGVAGTAGTAALGAVFAHYAFGFRWYVALLVATAVAPTDPAVVFSVLGRRRLEGRSGAILEGESGANDPVGISLMAGLIGAGALTAAGLGHVASTFALQMAVGTAFGVAGGVGLRWLVRAVPLPSPGLEPIRTLVAAFLIYGLTAVAHGSGFLAVFITGLLIGDEDLPPKADIEVFHGSVASLGEMAAFVTLGLTVRLDVISRLNVWAPGLAMGAVLALCIRPAVVRAALARMGLTTPERRFVQLAGLKGAVPILLGEFLLQTHLAEASRLYGIVIVVVAFSVAVQGGLVGPLIRRLGLPVSG